MGYFYSGWRWKENKKKRDICSDRLVRLLTRHGVSKHELARQLEISSTAVITWCDGVSLPSPENMSKLCAYFGVSKDYFTSDDIDDEAEHPQQLEIDAQPVQSVPMQEPVPVKFAGDDSALNDVIAAAVKYGGTVELQAGDMKVFATFFGQQNRKGEQ